MYDILPIIIENDIATAKDRQAILDSLRFNDRGDIIIAIPNNLKDKKKIVKIWNDLLSNNKKFDSAKLRYIAFVEPFTNADILYHIVKEYLKNKKFPSYKKYKYMIWFDANVNPDIITQLYSKFWDSGICYLIKTKNNKGDMPHEAIINIEYINDMSTIFDITGDPNNPIDGIHIC